MKTKKTPQRMCIVCKDMLDKRDLVRIVKTDSGIYVDKSGKMNGRGAYVCSNPECVDSLIKRKVLNKSFKENISVETYENIKKELLDSASK